MGSEWKEMPFSEAVLVNPPIRLEKGQTYPFVDMNAIDPLWRRVSESEFRAYKSGGARFKPGDTLMARITPCLENGKIAQYWPERGGMGSAFGSTEFIVIRGREGVTDNNFAYYLTKWQDFRRFAISQMTGSSGRQRVPTSALEHFSVPVPPLPEQRAIAHILGTLDDKIELNRRMNATLEAMARALFKSWFVDFDPVWENVRRKEENARAPGRKGAKGEEELRALASSRLGVEEMNARAPGRKGATEDLAAAHPGAPSLPEDILALFPDAFEESALGLIPQGWRVTPILEYAERLSGGTPKTSVPEYWNGDIKWVSAKDVRNAHGSFVLDTEKKVTALGIERSSAKILPANTTVVTARGTVGSYCLLAEPMSINQTNYGLKSKLSYGDYFVFFTLANLVGWLQQNSYGTIFDTITTRTFEQSKTVFPDTTLIQRFDEEVAPFMERMKANLYESRTLAGLRDTLLPRLISGELRVEDAERFLAEAGV